MVVLKPVQLVARLISPAFLQELFEKREAIEEAWLDAIVGLSNHFDDCDRILFALDADLADLALEVLAVGGAFHGVAADQQVGTEFARQSFQPRRQIYRVADD